MLNLIVTKVNGLLKANSERKNSKPRRLVKTTFKRFLTHAANSANLLISRSISDVYFRYNFDKTVNQYSFKQGKLGNCGMIAVMASLINNDELYGKVVPQGQRFKTLLNYFMNGGPSTFQFNLYKCGKPYQVVVNEKLPFYKNNLFYCSSLNSSFVGPLLEKALVALNYGGNYDLALGVNSEQIFSSLTNNFFEVFGMNYPKLNKSQVISHGLKTNSLMTVTFQNNITYQDFELKNNHVYYLLDIEENKVWIYNPHGRTIVISKKVFFDQLLSVHISYFENNIYDIPEIKTIKEFAETWPKHKENNASYIYYDLIIEDEPTYVLINLLETNNKDSCRCVLIVPVNDDNKNNNANENILCSCLPSKDNYSVGSSLGGSLKKGKYRIVISGHVYLYEDCLEISGDEVVLRLAASKKCSVKRPVKSENEELENALESYFAKFLGD